MSGDATADADPRRVGDMDYQGILTRFMDSAKHKREVEFLTFHQRNLTMQAYTNSFEYLARFFSLVVTEEWRCRKYEGGLKHELRIFLVLLRIKEIPVSVEQAKAVEQLEMWPTRVARL